MKIIVGLLVGCMALSEVFAQRAPMVFQSFSQTFMGESIEQTMRIEDGDAYLTWDPLTEPCPLNQADAIRLAWQALTNAFPQAQDMVLSSIELHTLPYRPLDRMWYYEISFQPQSPRDPRAQAPHVPVCIRVRLDGQVPPIEKGTRSRHQNVIESRQDTNSRLATKWEEQIKKDKGPDVFNGMTPEEKASYIKEYQFEQLRRGDKSVLPMRLTKEDDERLVKEGILPPLDKDKMPANQPQSPSATGQDSTQGKTTAEPERTP